MLRVMTVTGTAAARREERTQAIRSVALRSWEIMLFGVLPLVLVSGFVHSWLGSEDWGFDLRHAYLPAARDILDGVSPYVPPGDISVLEGFAYVYSPVLAFALLPLTAVSTGTAVNIGIVASLLCALAVLAVAGVRDWRCYGVVLVWAPVLDSAENVAASLPLTLLLAAAWRWRRKQVVSGALVGAAVALKLVVWPLLAWPLVMRRWHGAVAAAVAGVGLTFGTWAVIGFEGLSGYPDMVRALAEVEERESFSLSGTLLELGAGNPVARTAAIVVTGALLAGAVAFARRGDEPRAFVALLLAAMAATPILWQHYLVLLLLALAVTQPRLTVFWLLPLAVYLAPWKGNGEVWQTTVVPIVVTLVGIGCLLPRSRLGRLGGREPELEPGGYSSSPKSGVSTSPSA
jgi:hypothetical protein